MPVRVQVWKHVALFFLLRLADAPSARVQVCVDEYGSFASVPQVPVPMGLYQVRRAERVGVGASGARESVPVQVNVTSVGNPLIDSYLYMDAYATNASKRVCALARSLALSLYARPFTVFQLNMRRRLPTRKSLPVTGPAESVALAPRLTNALQTLR